MAAAQPSVALLFPGQGVQAAGMGEPWLGSESWSVVADISQWTGVDVADLLLEADAEALRRTDLAQLAVFTIGVVAHRDAARAGRLGRVVACAGHSLGELTALVAAGALTLRDGALLVHARGRAMRAAARRAPGTMAAVLGGTAETVEAIASRARSQGGEVWVANLNTPGQAIVSGTEAGIAATCSLAREQGLSSRELEVGGAFHTPLMGPAAEELRRALDRASFAPAHVPVVANVDGRAWSQDADWRDLLVRQLTSQVRWEEGVRTLVERLGCNRLVELGPGTMLRAMARRIVPGVDTAAITAAVSAPPSPAAPR